VFQARYAFSKVSLVSLVGGRPVGMGIDIVTTGAICRDIEVAMFIEGPKHVVLVLNTPLRY